MMQCFWSKRVFCVSSEASCYVWTESGEGESNKPCIGITKAGLDYEEVKLAVELSTRFFFCSVRNRKRLRRSPDL